MKTHSFILAAFLLFITGCKKECEREKFGAIQVLNQSGYEVKINLDGTLKGIVPPYGNTTIEKITSGYHTVQGIENTSPPSKFWTSTYFVQDCESIPVILAP